MGWLTILLIAAVKNNPRMSIPVIGNGDINSAEKSEKFAIGQTGNKKYKYVEAAKGTNLFFAIYQKETVDKETGRTVLGRSFATIPLNIAVERLKQHLKPVPEVNDNGDKLLFWLSPNDLVYVPTPDEVESGHISDSMDKSRIYKFVAVLTCDKPLFHFPLEAFESLLSLKSYQ